MSLKLNCSAWLHTYSASIPLCFGIHSHIKVTFGEKLLKYMVWLCAPSKLDDWDWKFCKHFMLARGEEAPLKLRVCTALIPVTVHCDVCLFGVSVIPETQHNFIWCMYAKVKPISHVLNFISSPSNGQWWPAITVLGIVNPKLFEYRIHLGEICQ